VNVTIQKEINDRIPRDNLKFRSGIPEQIACLDIFKIQSRCEMSSIPGRLFHWLRAEKSIVLENSSHAGHRRIQLILMLAGTGTNLIFPGKSHGASTESCATYFFKRNICTITFPGT